MIFYIVLFAAVIASLGVGCWLAYHLECLAPIEMEDAEELNF